VAFDQSFVDRVFVERPASVLDRQLDGRVCGLVDRREEARKSLSFTASDFASFASTMLRRNSISVSAEYGFFLTL